MNRILLAGATLLLCFGFAHAMPERPDAVVPIMETIRGEKPIELQSLRISARLRGGLAETTVRMEFHNPNPRPLEGNLQFPLLDGQQVTGFALDFDGRMREAVPVEKSRGRQAFEEIERRQVDPALLEKTQGNNFRLRVYPVPANGTRIVELRYSEALQRQDKWRRYRLPLAYGASLRDFRLEVDTDAPGRPRASGMFGDLDFDRRNGLYRAEVTRAAFAPRGELELLLPTPAKAQASVESRADGMYFVAEVPAPAASRARTMPRRVGLLWDSSMSGAARAHSSELELLDRYFRALGDGEVRLVRLRDRAEAPRDFSIRGGDWSALRRALESTQYDGASALADWRTEPGLGEYLLVSDGLLNYGPLGFPALAPGQRLYAINSSASADRDRLRALAEGSGGRLVEVVPSRVDDAARELLNEGGRVAALSGDGLVDLESAPGGARDGYLRVAGRLLTPGATLSIRFDDGSQAQVAIDASAPSNPLAAREWAGYRLAALAAQPELKRAEILRLGARFGLATSETSLIVLDRVEDYVEKDIAPPAELAEAYARLRAERDATRAKERTSHFDELLRKFNERIAWWEKDFPKGPKPRPKPEPKQHSGPTNSNSTGNIAGQTTPGALVVVENPATGFRREVTSDADGNYRVGHLPIGTYRVTAGGRTRDVQVQIGNTAAMSLDAVAVVGEPRPSRAVAAAPAAEALSTVTVMGGAIAADDKAEAEAGPREIAIEVKPWSAHAPYVNRMRKAKDDELYAIYLDERASYARSIGFYMDVADLLLQRGQKDLALRVLSNLAEMDLDNRQVLRVLGYRLVKAGEPALAVPVFEKVLRIADYEPQSFRDLGNAYAAAGRDQEAVDALAEVLLRAWDSRFSDIDLITLAEFNAIAATSKDRLDTSRVDARLRRNLPLDLRVVLTWDADDSDMDLWVTDPNGEKVYYGEPESYQGGRMSDDFTDGYGPEEYSLRIAKKGRYKVEVDYFGDSQQAVAFPTTLQLRFTTGFGTPAVKERLVDLRLKQDSDEVLVGEFEVE